ncbi:dihydrofolate reductase family protein [Actinoplanes sp. NEAU-A12]|uniref:Dihydrofolate reductase family protein n=1 Tax=Actinoplanes sandaracinus TaxID=3045177 RepID=A0ABT6X104_9ACTN|nr:dihydrofolate reductase family protein [Actinoplanes sandaracinus]MDI6105687.1 dihydrofolate reductase family protein [Actinoplanes sandaracinus]
MAGVIVQQWISVDGFLAGPNGEADVFAAVADFTASEAHNTALLAEVDEVLLGRRTYEAFAAYWPTAEDEPMARQVNTVTKTVCSTTLTSAAWGRHPAPRVVPDAVDHVRAGREARTRTMVWGSVSVMRALLAAGEVDDLELFVAPAALGSGTPLLAAGAAPLSLRLADSETWPGGVVRLRYAVG